MLRVAFSASPVRLSVASSLLLAASVVALAGCPEEKPKDEDEPHPLTGIYTVTAHTVEEPCEAEPLPADPAITRFKLENDSFFGADFLGFFDCSAGQVDEELDDDGCSTASRLDFAGFPPNDEVEFSYCSCTDDGTCSVGGSAGGWEKIDGGVQLVLSRLGGEVTGVANPDDCDPSALFEANEANLACEEITSLVGTKE